MGNEMMMALRQRFDARDMHIQTHPEFQREQRKIKQCFDQLNQSLDPEQKKWLMEWEECSTYLQAKEKEKLFYQGMMEGLHLSSAVYGSGVICSPEEEPS